MRAATVTVVVGTIAAVVIAVGPALANGGAYLELDRTHYLPGDRGVAITYVQIPEARASILDRGPFYLFALTGGAELREGEPIPMGALRIGTFSIEVQTDHRYELRSVFTVPRVAGAYYDLGVCNDPCTVSGFRESLSGTISIVATAREAELLTANARLQGRVQRLSVEARRSERRAERAEAQVGSELETNRRDRELLTAKIEDLEARLASATSSGGAGWDPWIVAAAVVSAVIAGVVMLRRRRAVVT